MLNTIPGSDQLLCSAGGHDDGLQFVLPAAPGELEWVTYRLPTNGYPASAVQVELVLIDGPAWFGIANYAKNSWEFGPGVAAPVYSRPITASHISPLGRVHIAIAAYDAATVRVVSAGIVLDQPGWIITSVDDVAAATPPTALQLFSDGPGDLPRLAALSANSIRLYSTADQQPAGPADWSEVTAAYPPGGATAVSPLKAEFINGKPAMAYVTHGDDWLVRYTYATLAEPGPGDWVSVDVSEPLPVTCLALGLCEFERKPRVLFENNSADSVWLASSPTASPGAGSWVRSRVRDGARRGSLALINGKLACSYLIGGAYSTSVYYATAVPDNPTSPGDWLEHDVWGPTSVNYYMMTDLGVTPLGADDAPIILWKPDSGSCPHICCAEVAYPSSFTDWMFSSVDPFDDVGGFKMELALAGGRPALAYYLDDARKLQFALAGTASPAEAADWQVNTLMSDADIGPLSVDEIGGQPAIAFVDLSTYELCYAYFAGD